jgi:hypothetical protein
MRRVVTAGVLIVCLGVFLCPAVGKPSTMVVAKKQSCCTQTSVCMEMTGHSGTRGDCAGEQSQKNGCCPIPCASLILFFTPAEGLSIPTITEQILFVSETAASARTERPPVPPPRG